MGTSADLPERNPLADVGSSRRKSQSTAGASSVSTSRTGTGHRVELPTESAIPRPTMAVKRDSSAGKPLTNSKTARATGVKIVTRPVQPAIDEAKIMEWLGVQDFAVQPTTAKSIDGIPAPAPSTSRSAAALPLTDHAVLSLVGDRLVERGIPSFTRVGIDVKQGVIAVRGTVASPAERLLLIDILQKTPGVRKVQDGLAVVRAGTRSGGFRLSDFMGSIPEIPSMTGVFSGIKPIYGGAALACVVLLAAIFWSRGPSRSVAVYPVMGRVVLEGEPLPKATILLHPVGKSKLPPMVQPHATANEDGGFSVGTFESADGAPEGEFVATVYLVEPKVIDGETIHGPNLLPAVYGRPETSPFRVKITRETKQISLLELHKKQ